MTIDTTFLGVIALATTVMAIIQVAVAVYAAKAAREATKAAQQLQRDLAPILANTRQVTDDAARFTALALTQIERVDQFVETTTARVDETLEVLQDVVMGPLREGSALVAGLKAALAFFSARQHRGRSRDDEDESLFIG